VSISDSCAKIPVGKHRMKNNKKARIDKTIAFDMNAKLVF
jgi:hypothetical protein